jgi:hypothetical protein
MRGITSKPRIEILGGRTQVYVLHGSVLLGTALILIGGVGSAASFPTSESLALVFWQIHCAGWVLAVSALILTFVIQGGSMIRVVEEIRAKAPMGSVDVNDEVTDLVMRLKRGRSLAPMVLPIGAGFWALHAFVLPLYWWLMLLHVWNNSSGCVQIWIMITNSRQQRNVLSFMTFGLVAASTGAGSSTMKSDRNTVKSNQVGNTPM